MKLLLRMCLAKVSLSLALAILSVVCCEAFLNIHDFSARVKAHRHIHPTIVSKPSTQLLLVDGWPDEEVAPLKKTTSDWGDFMRLREIHRAIAIGICSVAVLLWASPHQGVGGVFDDDVQMALLVVGYLVVGIPHGVLDLHLTPQVLPAREGGRPPSFPEWVAPYVGVMGLTLLVWLAAPTLALALFLLSTILHFGEGDVAVDNMTARGGAGPGSGLLARTEMFARGSYFGAFAVHHPAALAADVQGALGGADPSAALPLLAALGAAHYAALLVAIGARLARTARPPVAPGGAAPHAGVALEMTALSLLHAAAPARVAIFLYFLVFHAPRHVLRAARFSPGLLAAPGRDRRALRYGIVTVATMAAFAFLGVGLGWADLGDYALPAAEGGLESPEARLVLRFIVVGTSVLTTPHSVVIFLLGQKESEEKSDQENEVDTGLF